MSTDTALHVPCCPEFPPDPVCDVLDFHYRLKFPTQVTHRERRVTVEVIIHARFERCPGPLALGDLVYSTTLFPGEKVKLFTSDRRTRFTFDSSSQLSYRNQQTSEERFYAASVHDSMTDISVRDSQSASSSNRGSARGHGETSGAIESFLFGPSVDVSGSWDSSSTSSFLRELSTHAQSSDRRAETATRTANSVSVGEVSTRTHAEGSTEDQYESSSREFRNPNRCRAITFYFYQINKTQTIRFKIIGIYRRVIDPAANSAVRTNPFADDGGVDVIPNGILATDPKRFEVQRAAQVSKIELNAATTNRASFAGVQFAAGFGPFAGAADPEPIPEPVRDKALKSVDAELMKAGYLTENGQLNEKRVLELGYERTSSLPTPGLHVRSCLDDCDVCEPALDESIALEVERQKLENALLQKQIELLEKHQDYRCCPVSETDD
ncbi:MAG: hypothetical protein LDL19_05000 [Thiobacillus sp.]|nr:hypothetical protein [Thiobacillus sp.]